MTTSNQRYDDDDKDDLRILFEQAEENYAMNVVAEHTSPKFIKSEIANTIVYGMLDTGANVNLCPIEFINENNIPTTETKKNLKNPKWYT